jgi:dienelactone hydrolase
MLRSSPNRGAALGLVACLINFAASSHAEELPFRRHVIDADSTYCACAAIDVDHDGRLDIVAGGAWFQAPDWRRRTVREVEMIRGRYDDYSHLPLDVNGDGRLDLVSVNYRSQSLYWVEQPVDPEARWTKHPIDKPGAMETGRLVDIDGDGRLDVLPNGVEFAAWYELVPAGKPAGELIKHELPAEIAGHGLGAGDLNCDGRVDLVSSKGWLEAPPDPRAGRWLFHPDFTLHRDASIPIVVWDIDGDGDNDFLWGRGHGFGLYWMENKEKDGEGKQRWAKHVIDTNLSQAHSLLVADLDGDDRQELIAGKRYMGHDGKDVGEYDALGIYAYSFDNGAKAWRRRAIDADGPVGFGLDPKAVDLDGDGDIDILAPGRSGLYWLENLGQETLTGLQEGQDEDEKEPKVEFLADHTKLMHYAGEDGAAVPVKTPADWAKRREQIVAGMKAAMGELPDPSRRVPLDIEILEETRTDKYLRRKILYTPEPGDRAPAYLLLPLDALEGDEPGEKRPAMLCLHQTIGIGKGEPCALGGSENLHYAHELAERGFICLAPDYPSFGDYEFDFKKPLAGQTEPYASGTMKAIWNNLRAVDLLESLPEVDPDRIGCIGHSLGGHNSLYTAVFDQRLKAVVSSCGFNAFHHYFNGDLAGWTSDRYMPRIRELYDNSPDRVPFDFYEVVAAIAPRAFFTNSPLGDDNFAVEGVKSVMQEAQQVYDLLGAGDKLHAAYPDAAHDFPPPIREEVYKWLEKQL